MQHTVQRFSEHDNAFGFLRLALASLVIVSHTPELIDGDRHRELLTQIFHTISFGEFAVDGFFVVSGFLITASYLGSSGNLSFLFKRVARIYPAFVVSSLICVLIIGPITGAIFTKGTAFSVVSVIAHIALLLPPAMENVFPGTFYRVLNGAAWTIQYEFLCYLFVLALGSAGLLRSRRIIATVSAICLLAYSFGPPTLGLWLDQIPFNNVFLLASRITLLRLGGMFFAGATFYLFQDKIPLTKSLAMFALAGLAAALFSPWFASFGFAIFGSYALFSIASLGSGTILAQINSRQDISYGVYLYAWPIAKTLNWLAFSTNLLLLGSATFLISVIAGTISWFLVEKPVMAVVRSSVSSLNVRKIN